MLEIKFTVSLSDDTKAFLETLFSPFLQGKGVVQQPKLQNEPTTKEAIAEQLQKQQEPVQQAQQEPQTSLTINDIRAEVMNKVNNNREAIKNKLTEMGIKRVTELVVSQYDEFYEFLKNLE